MVHRGSEHVYPKESQAPEVLIEEEVTSLTLTHMPNGATPRQSPRP